MVLGKMIPHFGNRLVSSIRTEDVKTFIKYLRDHPHNEKGLGNRRINMVMQVLYQTRHTFATLMLTAREDIGWIAKQLGHQDIQMIMKHYYRWVPRLTPP